jgi:hypothetical protein
MAGRECARHFLLKLVELLARFGNVLFHADGAHPVEQVGQPVNDPFIAQHLIDLYLACAQGYAADERSVVDDLGQQLDELLIADLVVIFNCFVKPVILILVQIKYPHIRVMRIEIPVSSLHIGRVVDRLARELVHQRARALERGEELEIAFADV